MKKGNKTIRKAPSSHKIFNFKCLQWQFTCLWPSQVINKKCVLFFCWKTRDKLVEKFLRNQKFKIGSDTQNSISPKSSMRKIYLSIPSCLEKTFPDDLQPSLQVYCDLKVSVKFAGSNSRGDEEEKDLRVNSGNWRNSWSKKWRNGIYKLAGCDLRQEVLF